MTDSNPFFRFVWRVNALLIFGLALVVGLFVAYQLGRDLLRSRVAYRAPDRGLETPLPAPEGAPDTAPREVLHVGMFTQADGAIYVAPVFVGAPGDGYKNVSSVKGASERVRNIVLFDSTTGAVSRLFPDDKGRVLDEDVIVRSRHDWPRSRTMARIYVHVATDTNGDGRLDWRDRQRIVITQPDGSRPTVLVDDVDRYGLATTPDGQETKLSYFVRRDGELLFGEFDLETFEAGRTTPVKVPRT